MSWFDVKKDTKKADRLYVLEIVIEGVIVYKVGKASGGSSKDRMLSIISSYFDVYRVTPAVRIVRDRACEDVFTKENECHKRLKEYSFESDKAFSGHTELFETSKDIVLEVYEDVLQCCKDS